MKGAQVALVGVLAIGLLGTGGCGSTGPSTQQVGSLTLSGASFQLPFSIGPESGPGVSERALAQGRFLVFQSPARLTPQDNNSFSDVFLHDFRLGKTSLVSLNADLQSGNGAATGAQITANGRFVVFQSAASDLVPGDQNGVEDIFVRDLFEKTTTRASLGVGGVEANSPCHSAAITTDGRFVVFCSVADNLVPGDNNGAQDVFLRDLISGATTVVSLAPGGRAANGPSFEPTITPDGKFLAFSTEASAISDSPLRKVVLQQRDGSSRTILGRGPAYAPSLSDDGTRVAFFSTNIEGRTDANQLDQNGRFQVLVHSVRDGVTSLLSKNPNGQLGDDHSGFPRISGDGTVVVFSSLAGNLVSNDSNGTADIFSVSSSGGVPTLISQARNGKSGNASSDFGVVSNDGSVVAFRSQATDLVAAASTGAPELFLRSRQGNKITRASHSQELPGLWPGFAEPSTFLLRTNGGNTSALLAVVADFNGDTVPDVVGSGTSGIEYTELNGDGLGGFAQPGLQISDGLTAQTTVLLAENFFADGVSGIPDLFRNFIDLVVGREQTLGFVNLGPGMWAAPFGPPGRLLFAASDDFNNDGRPDIAAISITNPSSGPVGQLYLGPQFGIGGPLQFESGNSGLATGDLNRDALSDVVMTDDRSGEVVVSLMERTSVSAAARYPVGPNPQSPVVADFNRDGRLDVACVTSQGIALMNGRGNGTLSPASMIPLLDLRPLAAGDFNRDGKLDLVTMNGSSVLLLLLGRGDGSFQAERSFQSVGRPNLLPPPYLQLADLEPDGDLDVVVPDNSGPRLAVHLNQLR